MRLIDADKIIFREIDEIGGEYEPYLGCSKSQIDSLPSVTPQEPKFIAKSDGTIEQIKNCNDCLFKKEWEKIGKLISVVLKKQTEQEPTTKNDLAQERYQEWIPVSERLPDTDDEVLCWYEYYHWSQEKVLPEYGLGCYFKETKSWFGEVANGHKVRVIAWMPLPKPYDPQESEEE